MSDDWHRLWQALESAVADRTARLEAFEEGGTIGSRPEGGGAPGAVSLDEQVELGWIAKYDAGYLDQLPPV